MPSSVFLVHQDCVDCKPMADWLAADWDLARERGIEIIKLPFFKKGAPELIRKAAENGITLPFFSDGEKVAKHLPKLLEDISQDADGQVFRLGILVTDDEMNEDNDGTPKRRAKRKRVKDGAEDAN